MTTHEKATLAFRLFGIYLFVSGITVIRDFTFLFSSERLEISLLRVIAVAFAVLLAPLLGLAFWRFADAFASRATQGLNSLESDASQNSDIQIIAFSILGLYFSVQAIFQISHRVVIAADYRGAEIDGMPFIQHFFSYLPLQSTIPLLIELSIGLWLLLGAASLSRMLQRFRGVGFKESSD